MPSRIGIGWIKHWIWRGERRRPARCRSGRCWCGMAKKIGEGWNRPIGGCDPTAHAEVLALRAAAERTGNYRLVNSTLYATLEPCPMCAGAMCMRGSARVVFGATDPRAGAAGTCIRSAAIALAQPSVRGESVLAEECGLLLREFFRARRIKTGPGVEALLSAG
jgi:tRNA(adenine34) deaminase